MVNITSIVNTVGGTGLKAVGLIPNSTVTDTAVTVSAPINIANWIIFILILFIIWKIFLKR